MGALSKIFTLYTRFTFSACGALARSSLLRDIDTDYYGISCTFSYTGGFQGLEWRTKIDVWKITTLDGSHSNQTSTYIYGVSHLARASIR